jgi:hypothetical protein
VRRHNQHQTRLSGLSESHAKELDNSDPMSEMFDKNLARIDMPFRMKAKSVKVPRELIDDS